MHKISTHTKNRGISKARVNSHYYLLSLKRVSIPTHKTIKSGQKQLNSNKKDHSLSKQKSPQLGTE